MIRHVRGDQVTVVDAHGARRPFPSGSAKRQAGRSSCRTSCPRCGATSPTGCRGAGFGQRQESERQDEVHGIQHMAANEAWRTRVDLPATYSGIQIQNLKSGPEPRTLNPEPSHWLQSETGCCPYAAEQAAQLCRRPKGGRRLRADRRPRSSSSGSSTNRAACSSSIHAPLGARINKAWGLALRKRFCRSFDFELQAAADDNGVLLSIGPQHSFPIDSLFGMLNSQQRPRPFGAGGHCRAHVRRPLAVERHAGPGRAAAKRRQTSAPVPAKVPQRRSAGGRVSRDGRLPRKPPRRRRDPQSSARAADDARLPDRGDGHRRGGWSCSTRSRPGAVKLIPDRHRASRRRSATSCSTPQPYAFLDDAPLEERRTRAVTTRRSLAIEEVQDLSKLDPQAIAAGRRAKPGRWSATPTSCTTR